MATLEEIAQAAGVSRATASRILNTDVVYKRPTFAKRAAKVKKIAAKLGYRPNAAARIMQQGRFGTFGLIWAYNSPFLPVAMLNGITQEMNARKLRLNAAGLDRDRLDHPDELPLLLRELSVDGLLLPFLHPWNPDSLAEMGLNVPIVWINYNLDNDAAYPNEYKGGRDATEYLLDLGHHRIAMLGFCHVDRHFAFIDRVRGYKDAMANAGLEAQVINEPFDWQLMHSVDAPQVECIKQTLSADDRPTAFVAFGESSAYPAQIAALQLGMELPKDLSIISFYPGLMANSGIPITTMDIPFEPCGREAVAMLEEKVKSPGKELASRVIDYPRLDGVSCSPPA